MIGYIVIFIISVCISSTSQILLKKSTEIERGNKLKEYLNIYVISAYGLLFLSTLLTMFAYKKVNLSVGVVIEAIGYIIVAVLSYFFLKEKFTKNKIIGIILIIIGVIIFGICS
ncbi:MAG: EamA family transporter [Clostridia bacterium]|nr:EamA family transporter [Clostridia bacterium]